MKATIVYALAILFVSSVSLPALAATQTEKEIKAEYKTAVTQANADYKSAYASCNAKQGNDKDVCRQQAKATRDKTKVSLVRE